jgi:transaldolase
MKYFLDSAKLNEIAYAYDTFGIDGVTTNPRHVQASGKPFLDVIAELAAWVKSQNLVGIDRFPVSVEVNPHLETAEEMIAEGRKLAVLSPNFVIKIPCTEQGIKASRVLEKQGVRTNVTLVFSASQALIAAKNGAKFVSPFIGWKEASGEDCREYIRNIVQIHRNYKLDCEVICAAVRSGKQIVDCALAGADIVTAGLDIYQESFLHPFTTKGLAIFSDAWDKTATK